MATIGEAQLVLGALGLPRAQQNEISALTLVVLAGLGPTSQWSSAKPQTLKIHDMMSRMKADWGKTYAENTRETVRRQVIHQLEQARVVDRNPDEPTLATNSPRTHYRLTVPALQCLRFHGTRRFAGAVRNFKRDQGDLQARYVKARSDRGVPVVLPKGLKLVLSPGKHNEVQREFVSVFLPRFATDAEILYFGDTAKKAAFIDNEQLARLGLKLSDHGKLPDVILWNRKRSWLFLVEIVTSHGPVSPKRENELRTIFGASKCGLVFVTAFPDRAEFRRHLSDIAWETEVWIAEEPTHLIHFNGNRFLGPHDSA